jgi:hypothetical protein
MRKNEMMSVLRPNQFQPIQLQAKLIAKDSGSKVGLKKSAEKVKWGNERQVDTFLTSWLVIVPPQKKMAPRYFVIVVSGFL